MRNESPKLGSVHYGRLQKVPSFLPLHEQVETSIAIGFRSFASWAWVWRTRSPTPRRFGLTAKKWSRRNLEKNQICYLPEKKCGNMLTA